jgi:hypothetical protein
LFAIRNMFFRKRKEIEKIINRKSQLQDVVLGSSNRRIISLREKIWKFTFVFQIGKFWKFLYRHRLAASLIFIFSFSVFGFLAYQNSVSAKIAVFYPGSALGSWKNPENAQDKPDLSESAKSDEFTEKNSAILDKESREIYLGKFEGSIPKDSSPKEFSLSFSWEIKGTTTENDILDIFYTLDNETWKKLGSVNAQNWKGAEFKLPLNVWDDLSKVQIAVKSKDNLDEGTVVYLDGVKLSVEYKKIESKNKYKADDFERLPKKKISADKIFDSEEKNFQANEKASFLIKIPNQSEVAEIEAEDLKIDNPESDSENESSEVVDAQSADSSGDQNTELNNPIPDQESDSDQKTSSETEEPIAPASEEPLSFFNGIKELLNVETAKAQIAEVISSDAIKTIVTDPKGNEVEIVPEIIPAEGYAQINMPEPGRDFIPGKYKIQVQIIQDGEVLTSEQDFTWGVLAINTNKSIYTPSERANLAMAVLDESGNMVCNAKLTLKIENKDQDVSDELSTENGKIKVNPECQIKGFTLNPDYQAEYEMKESGTYQLTLTSETQNGKFTIRDEIEVKKDVPFDVERTTATRIYPPENYPVSFNIIANQDFKGEIQESVPASFDVLKSDGKDYQNYDQEEINGDSKILSWKVDLKKGDRISLGYQFKAPNVSPEFYLLGPLSFFESGLLGDSLVFEEARKWQIAADSTIVYVGGATGTGTGATYSVSLTSLTGGIASAAAEGDIVIVTTGWAGPSASNGNPGVTTSGYTELSDIYGSDTRSANLSVDWKIMSSTPDTSVTVSGYNNAAYGGATVVQVFRGVDQSTPIDVTTTTATGTNSNLANAAAITPTNAGALILACGIGTTDSTPTAKTLPSTTEIAYPLQVSGTGSTNSAIAAMFAIYYSQSAAYDPAAWSGGENDTTNDSRAIATVALRPQSPYGPRFQAAGTAVSATTGTLTVAWPTHVAGDVALLFVESQANAATLNTANGFTQLGTTQSATGTRLDVFWARANSEAMASPVVAANSDHAYGVILTFRGCAAGGDPFSAYAGDVKSTASTTSTAPAVTTTETDQLIVIGVTKSLDATTAFASAETNSNLQGIVERTDAGTTSGNGGGIATMTGIMRTAGSTGTTSITVTSTASAMMTIALRGTKTSPTVVQDTADANDFGTDNTPTLQFTGTDTESDDIRYNVQICSSADSGCTSPTLDRVSGTDDGFSGSPDGNDPFASDQQVSFTVQSGDALGDGTFYWRVRGMDPNGSGAYGAWSSIRSFTVTLPQITVSGGCFTDSTEGTACTDDGSDEIRVAVNGVLQTGSDTTVDSSWSFNISQPISGDILVFFRNGEATEVEETTTVVKYDGSGNLDLVKMYQSMLVLGTDTGSVNSAQTISISDLATSGNGYENSDDEDVLHGVSSGDLTVDAEGTHTETLYIIGSNVYQSASGGGGDTTTLNLTNEGTLTADSNTFYISGALASTGTFNSNTSTFDFNGSDTQTIPALNYYNLTSSSLASGTITRTGSVLVQDLSTNNTGSTSITVPTDADYMTVGVTSWSSVANFLSGGSVTLNSASLSVISSADSNNSYDYSALFGLKAPSTGSQTLAWDWAGTGSALHHCYATISFYKGVNQTTPIRDFGSEQGYDTANVTTGSMTAQSGDMAVAVLESDTSTVSWSGATQVAYTANAIYYAEASPSSDVTIIASNVYWGAISGGVLVAATASPGARTLASSGTIGIAGTFTPGSGSYTITGSTVTYNGTAGQSISAFSYNNLTITNASASGVTFTDSVTVGGTFTDTTNDSKLIFTTTKTFSFANITIHGTSSHNVIMTSTNASPGTASGPQWLFNVSQASPTVSYVTVYDSNASGSSGAIDATSNCANGGNNTNWNFGSADTTPPTPNPMTFATAPGNDSASQISMTATTASDATTPVNYLFTNDNSTCGSNSGAGGTTSSWQSSTSYSDSGLAVNKCYGYTVTARDSASTPNVGTASSVSITYTSANTPGTPTLNGATTNTLNLTNSENSNPSSNPTTYFAVQITTTSPSDSNWLNKWTDATGNPSASAVWLTDAQLDALTLHGLVSSTTYGVKVKARNQDGDETSLSAEGQGTTSASLGVSCAASATMTAYTLGDANDYNKYTFGVPEACSITGSSSPWTFTVQSTNMTSTNNNISSTNIYLEKDGNVTSGDTITDNSSGITETAGESALNSATTIISGSSATGSYNNRPTIEIKSLNGLRSENVSGTLTFTVQ